MKYSPILSVLFLACSVFAVDSAESRLEHRSASEAYTEPELGISFPSEAGPFRKQEVIRSFNPLIGTTIRYADREGHCADIYIYSLPDAETVSDAVLESHFQNVKKAILSLPSKGRRVTASVLRREVPLSVSGKKAGYTAVFRLTFSGSDSQDSILSMVSVKDRIVKLRMTCEESLAEKFSGAVLPLLAVNP